MNRLSVLSNGLPAFVLLGVLVGCSEPRAVVLPLQYPNGAPVRATTGEPLMAGFHTYGSPMHANATAIYEQAKTPSCATCARVGAVVTEPSAVRQITGVVGTAAIGSGAVMTGIGVMEYGHAAGRGKLQDNVSQTTSSSAGAQSNTSSKIIID